MAAATRILPKLYPHTTDLMAVTDTEILQLLETELAGPSTKFLDGALGILSLDDGKYVAACKGKHPRRLATEIEKTGGVSGQTLVATFIGPPYGYPSDLVRACCAGLLRGGKLRISPEVGDAIKSYRDPGVRDLFTKNRAFRRAEFFPPAEEPVSRRDRIAMGKFFETTLEAQLDRENEAFADAAFKYFPHQREVLRELEQHFNELPGRPALPERLTRLGKALEDCCRHRPMDKIALELKRNLDALRDGMVDLQILKAELTEEAIAAVRDAAEVKDYHLAQLVEAAGLTELTGPAGLTGLVGVDEDAESILEHFESETPWRGIHTISDACRRIRERYVEVRRGLLGHQGTEAEAAQARLRRLAGFEAVSVHGPKPQICSHNVHWSGVSV